MNKHERKKEIQRKSYWKNVERNREKARQYYHSHRSTQIEKAKRKLEKNYEAHMLRRAKMNAKNRHLDFSITIDDIVISEICPFLESPLTRTMGQGMVDSNTSLDRIDSSKGYIQGNIQVVSTLANRIKSNSTTQQLLTFCKNFISRYQ